MHGLFLFTSPLFSLAFYLFGSWLVSAFEPYGWLSIFNVRSQELAYECGFSPISEIRGFFSLRLSQIVIFFLIFEVEVLVLLSLPLASWGYVHFSGVFFFLLVVVSGLYYEARQGSLNWPR